MVVTGVVSELEALQTTLGADVGVAVDEHRRDAQRPHDRLVLEELPVVVSSHGVEARQVLREQSQHHLGAPVRQLFVVCLATGFVGVAEQHQPGFGPLAGGPRQHR